MSTPNPARGITRFGEFVLDRRTGGLFREGRKLKIQGQPVLILEALLNRPGDLVTQEDLVSRLWPEDTHVDFDQGLRSAVQRLRNALGDSSEHPRFIETVPRRGYRYIGPPPVEGPPAGPGSERPPRWGTLGSLGRPVRAAAVAVILIVAGITLVSTWRESSTSAGPPPLPHKLAVLSLRSLDAEDGEDAFSAGLTAEILAQLSKLNPERLEIVAQTASSRYHDVTEITYAMKLDFVLEGTVRREGGRARVSVHLVPITTRTTRWGETYEVEIADAFEAQKDIAKQIAAALALALDL